MCEECGSGHPPGCMACTITCAVNQTRQLSFTPLNPSTHFVCRQLVWWQKRLSHNNCTPLIAVATALLPPLRKLHYVPTLFVSMGAAKAHQRGQVLGLYVVTAMGFSFPFLSRYTRVTPTALSHSSSWRWLTPFPPSTPSFTTSLVSFWSRTHSSRPFTSRTTKQRTMCSSARVSTRTPCPQFSSPNRSSMCATSLA
eukprot:6206377-Pleurochrysis_carterae.AAC.3